MAMTEKLGGDRKEPKVYTVSSSFFIINSYQRIKKLNLCQYEVRKTKKIAFTSEINFDELMKRLKECYAVHEFEDLHLKYELHYTGIDDDSYKNVWAVESNMDVGTVCIDLDKYGELKYQLIFIGIKPNVKSNEKRCSDDTSESDESGDSVENGDNGDTRDRAVPRNENSPSPTGNRDSSSNNGDNDGGGANDADLLNDPMWLEMAERIKEIIVSASNLDELTIGKVKGILKKDFGLKNLKKFKRFIKQKIQEVAQDQMQSK